MYERYEDLIRARAEHIKHSMRMVRVHKANELVNAEIDRLTIVVQDKKQKFDQELDRQFGTFTEGTEEYKARNAVYMRLAGQVEAGSTNFYNEFRGWYWGSNQWQTAYGQQYYNLLLAGGQMQVTPSQQWEAALGFMSAGATPGADQQAIATWLNAGGTLSEWGGFQGNYFALLMAGMANDMMTLKHAVTVAIATPMIPIGYGMVAGGMSLISSGMATILFGGATLVAQGSTMVAAGYSTVRYAIGQITMSSLQLLMTQLAYILQMSNAMNSAGAGSVMAAMQKHKEYEEAKARLEYFTKVPDMQTMKERMIQYGAQHGDNDSAEALYKLTDEDLKYLFERDTNGDAQYIDQNGNAETLTAEEENEALELTHTKSTQTYLDSYGRPYDPNDVLNYAPAPLSGGSYGGYTRIKQVHHNGSYSYQYARLVNTEAESEKEVYDMGEALEITATHGQQLREDRKARYYAEGNAIASANNDVQMVYAERDDTFEQLFTDAAGHAEGGREYTGYRMTSEEYLANQNDIFNAELNQRKDVQLKEWELREQELQDRYNVWETRMQAVLERGTKAWSGIEAKYLQEWRQWERDRDKEEAEAEQRWDEKIAEHFSKKEQWETDIRNNASEVTIQQTLSGAVDSLNAQIAVAESNLQTEFESINKQTYINAAIQSMLENQPSATEKFKQINDNIKTFKTQLSVSELTGANTLAGAATIAQQYREQMIEHQQNMRVKANVQIFEQYRQLIEAFKTKIEVQNEAVDNRTTADAQKKGFIRQGDSFISPSGITTAWGMVQAYQWFDTDTAVDRELQEMGFSQKSGDDLFSFLKQKDTVEIEAYFYTQKLAAQRVFEIIMGTGTKEERKNSRDDSVIGTFGMWAGKAPGDEEKGVSYETMQNVTTMMGENFLSGYSGGNLAMDNILYGGFGEIGNYGMRPSGLQMGFYPQLQLAAMFQADGERKSMNKASATVDPVATIVNQYNPLVMLANAQKNVELAHVDGKDRGYMWEAQLLDMTKSGMSAIAGLVSAIPIVGPVIGSVIQFMASSIKVDPTTGDRLFRSDDEAAIAAASVLLGGSLLTAGMEYDEEGRSQGWNGDKAVEQGTLDIIGALLGGGLVSDFINNSYHITKEYEKARAGKDSNYLYYQNVGLGRLGSLAGMIISQEAQKSSAFQKAYDQWKGNKESMVDYANNGPKPGDPARGTTYNLFAGIAAHFANNESTYKKIGGFLNPFSKQGLGQYLHALGAESVGNYLTENIFRNDKKISIYEERILAAGTTEEAQRAMEQEIAKGNLSRERAEQAYYEGENLRAMDHNNRVKIENGYNQAYRELYFDGRKDAANEVLDRMRALNMNTDDAIAYRNYINADYWARNPVQGPPPPPASSNVDGSRLIIRDVLIPGLSYVDAAFGSGWEDKARNTYNDSETIQIFDKKATGYYDRAKSQTMASVESAVNRLYETAQNYEKSELYKYYQNELNKSIALYSVGNGLLNRVNSGLNAMFNYTLALPSTAAYGGVRWLAEAAGLLEEPDDYAEGEYTPYAQDDGLLASWTKSGADFVLGMGENTGAFFNPINLLALVTNGAELGLRGWRNDPNDKTLNKIKDMIYGLEEDFYAAWDGDHSSQQRMGSLGVKALIITAEILVLRKMTGAGSTRAGVFEGIGQRGLAAGTRTELRLMARQTRALRNGAFNSGGTGGSGFRPGSGGGQGPRVRSMYADGTRVLQGQQPPRIKGPVSGAQDRAHSVLRYDPVNKRVYQAREFNSSGHPLRDIDFTSPTYPNGLPRPDHLSPPHQHRWFINDPRIGPRSGFFRGGPETYLW